MQIQEVKYAGLVSDLMPNIRLMQGFGHCIFRYITGPILIRKLYSVTHFVLLFFQFACTMYNLIKYAGNVNELTCKVNFHFRKFLELSTNPTSHPQPTQSRCSFSLIASQSSSTCLPTRKAFIGPWACGISRTQIHCSLNQILGMKNTNYPASFSMQNCKNQWNSCIWNLSFDSYTAIIRLPWTKCESSSGWWWEQRSLPLHAGRCWHSSARVQSRKSIRRQMKRWKLTFHDCPSKLNIPGILLDRHPSILWRLDFKFIICSSHWFTPTRQTSSSARGCCLLANSFSTWKWVCSPF